MKKVLAVAAIVALFAITAVPVDARGQGGRGGGGGGQGGGGGGGRGQGVRGQGVQGGGGRHYQGHRFHHGHGHGHGHGHWGSAVVIGGWYGPYWGGYWDPYWYPGYYPYAGSAYYPASAAYAPMTEPLSYIEQPAAQSYWYYCEEARAYFPYVQQCPAGWLTVVPQAAPESRP